MALCYYDLYHQIIVMLRAIIQSFIVKSDFDFFLNKDHFLMMNNHTDMKS